jgi:hypothetical protein
MSMVIEIVKVIGVPYQAIIIFIIVHAVTNEIFCL